MSARRNQTVSAKLFFLASIAGQQCHTVSQHLLHDRAADSNSPIFSACAIECKNPARFKRSFIRQQDGATLGRNNFEKQFEKSFQQIVEPTNRIDDGADFHERAQIAGHLVERVVETDLDCRAADYLRFVESNVTRFRSGFALVCEEDEMCVADANTIAMLERAILDGNIVNEGAVKTLEIGDYKSRFLLFNSGVTARN